MKKVKNKFKNRRFLMSGYYRNATDLTQSEIEELISEGFGYYFKNCQRKKKMKCSKMLNLQKKQTNHDFFSQAIHC